MQDITIDKIIKLLGLIVLIGELAIQGHEFEGFLDELELFGAWNGPNENLIKTVQQMPLFD